MITTCITVITSCTRGGVHSWGHVCAGKPFDGVSRVEALNLRKPRDRMKSRTDPQVSARLCTRNSAAP